MLVHASLANVKAFDVVISDSQATMRGSNIELALYAQQVAAGRPDSIITVSTSLKISKAFM